MLNLLTIIPYLLTHVKQLMLNLLTIIPYLLTHVNYYLLCTFYYTVSHGL